MSGSKRCNKDKKRLENGKAEKRVTERIEQGDESSLNPVYDSLAMPIEREDAPELAMKTPARPTSDLSQESNDTTDNSDESTSDLGGGTSSVGGARGSTCGGSRGRA